ncbi:hypothetical protein [Desulfoscipio geothermicus]|uniref:Uncharacterized protein n=1 Tax=Desulfoscipio geothermicus DSM 3669 TaxID=1121426 RepID=A0A1I6E1Y3_9FIRM|nr:hypothetical protein [Desulfoscipio geothermicus]SFR11705.1 hypothetical protein SAMN05660706_12344 [Desulfoscipio geothermicus DSM 3669]
MKSSGSKAKGGRIRSLHIKLPADHPVFSFPEGERSRVAREWLEQGRQVLSAMEAIQRDIADLKRVINNSGPLAHVRPENNAVGKKMQSERKNDINPAVFLDL